ncbi:MAG: hypothetical protein V1901_03810 [Patescibacteria group bacterium]
METQIKETIKEEEAEKILKDMQEKYELSELEEMIKNNEYMFKHEDNQYRVRLLDNQDKEELDFLRRKKFGQLIQDKDILMKKDLIKIYKDRDIDVEDMEKSILELEAEKFNYEMKLGEALSKKLGDSIIKEYNAKITEVMVKINVKQIQINTLLDYSLESQLLNYVAEVITYLSFEILELGEWKRVYENFELFRKSKEDAVIGKAAKLSLCLQYL